jgi:hypothetical protein
MLKKIRQNASGYPFYVAKFARPLCFHEFSLPQLKKNLCTAFIIVQ